MLHAAFLGGLGLIAGSFIGLVSLRLPRGEDVVVRRSHCGGCGRDIPPWRMIPVLSWALSRGRCGDCGAVIPRRYPLIETGCGLIGVWAGLHGAGDLTLGLMTALLGWQLLLIALVDGEHFWLPDQLTLPLFATGLLAAVLLHPAGLDGWGAALIASLIGAAAGFGALWLVGWAYRRVRGREGLGGGDPFLMGAGGAWVGWTALPSVLLWASLAGLSVVAAMLIVRRRVSATDRLPFGVFLAIGLWLTWLFGPLGLS